MNTPRSSGRDIGARQSGGTNIGARQGVSRADAPQLLHAEMLARLEALEDGLAQLIASRTSIGHNQPPAWAQEEPITPEELAKLTAAVTILKLQPVAPASQPPDAVEAAQLIQSSAQKVQSYVAKKGDAFVTGFVKSAGSEAGKWAVRVTSWAVLFELLKSAFEAASAWLQALPPMP